MASAGDLSDICNDDFKTNYYETIRILNTARERHQRGNRLLSIDRLRPEELNQCAFMRNLPRPILEKVKMLYDMSVSSTSVEDMLYVLCVEYETCTYVKSQQKYHVCDLNTSNHVPNPVGEEDWTKLLFFIQSFIHSGKMKSDAMLRRKKIKSRIYQTKGNMFQTTMMKNMTENNQAELGSFCGCVIWFLETANMNKKYVVQNSNAGTMVYNKGSDLCRKLPTEKKVPVIEKVEEVEEEEDNEAEKSVADNWEDVADNWEDVADSWEDLADNQD